MPRFVSFFSCSVAFTLNYIFSPLFFIDDILSSTIEIEGKYILIKRDLWKLESRMVLNSRLVHLAFHVCISNY